MFVGARLQLQKNEGYPPLPTTFGWVTRPTTSMGLCPHGPREPEHHDLLAYYAGATYDDWPYVTPWVVVFPDGISSHPTKSGVRIRNLGLAYFNTLTGKWVVCCVSDTPPGQYRGLPNFGELFAENNTYHTDSVVVRPPPCRCAELWVARTAFDYQNIGAICAWCDHKLEADADGAGDRWLVQIGADYYPSLGAVPAADIVGVGCGRIQHVRPYWRTAILYLDDGMFDYAASPPPVPHRSDLRP